MTDRPIIFSAPMVRALLDGRKTMTRRVLKLPTKTREGQPIYEHPKMGGWEPTTVGGGGCFRLGKNGEKIPVPEQVAIWHRTCGVCIAAPYQPGDRLWVRETWAFYPGVYQGSYGFEPPNEPTYPPHFLHGDGIRRAVTWRARTENNAWGMYGPPKWRSPIHCPRTASRLTLIVTAVKIERLQDISEEDAIAEGITKVRDGCFVIKGFGYDDAGLCHSRAVIPFGLLWNHLHGEDAWDANPEVVAPTFAVHQQNIDSMPKAEAA